MRGHKVASQVKKWIETVVIDCNFCPFAAKEIKKKSVRYVVDMREENSQHLDLLIDECKFLGSNSTIETTLIIFEKGYTQFEMYLDLVQRAEAKLLKQGFEGIYQLATFHPAYCFDGEDANEVSNYTNRSPFPILHLLREESIYKLAQKQESNLESIPMRNIAYAEAHGLKFFQEKLDACNHIEPHEMVEAHSIIL